MFKHRLDPFALRGAMAAACLLLLAACNNPQDAVDPTGPTDPVVTQAPTDLSATAGDASVALSWTSSSNASSYKVKRKSGSGGTYTQIATPTSAAYMDTTVANGTAYMYVVSAMGSAGESTDSSPASATPQAAPTAPMAPTGLMAVAGNAQVSLSWTASVGATQYSVKRSSTSGGSYTQIATSMSTSYTDTTASNGATYYYVVSAGNAQGQSPNSAQVSITLAAVVTAPAAPTGLAATAGNAQVALSWTASGGATGYKVKRSTTSGSAYSQIATPSGTSYTDAAVANGTTYYYVVTAGNSAGDSANSTQVSALPAAPTPPPTTFGTWYDVTPSGASASGTFSCGNYGAETVQKDPAHPSNLYAQFNCQGIWKSTDYGATWTGPINTGTNGATAGDCAGGLTIPPGSTASAPTIYLACIRGNGTGFWRSPDGGVNWTRYNVAPSGSSRQDYYPPVVDPYDQNHLVMAGHEMNYLVESIDGGQNWTNVTLAGGMMQNGGTAAIFFINTGSASSTRSTWLWMAQATGGSIGTWRTTNSGGSWTQVDKNEHSHGASQVYQPDNGGVFYMAGVYSNLGWGVLRSTDYGQTWAHVGVATQETVVAGSSKNVYSMYGYPVGAGGTIPPAFQIGAQPGTGTWVSPGTPAGLTQGPAQLAIVNDGSHNIIVGAMWNSGLWRYVEP